MAEVRLHLDADFSIRALHSVLVTRGYDVTRTPNDWMPEDASDEMQLLKASAQGRCIVTFNIRDFSALASRYPQHQGIILAAQSSWTLSDLIVALERMLVETRSED